MSKKLIGGAIVILCSIFFLWGNLQNKEHVPTRTKTPEHIATWSIVHVCISDPYLPHQRTQNNIECTSIWHGIVIDWWYILTAKHIFTTHQQDTFLLQDLEWTYNIKNRWEHPYEDLALITPHTVNVQRIESSLHKNKSCDTTTSYAYTSTNKLRIARWNCLTLSGNTLTTDMSLSPWRSGSPIFNEQQYLIGINTAISNQTKKTSHGLAIDKQRIDSWIQDIESNK